MKIVYLLGSLNRGGTETLLLHCFRNAAKAGFDFAGCYRKEGALSDDFKATAVPLYKITPKSKFDIGYLFRLRKTIRLAQATIIHAQQPIDALYACLASLGTSVKVALTFHGYDMEASYSEKLLIRMAIRLSDKLIFVSNAQMSYYRQHYRLPEAKTTTAYNGIAFNPKKEERKNDLREELNINAKTLLLGSIGNFVPGRDQITLCRFLKLLDKKQIDFRFLFIGKKNLREEWRYDQCFDFCSVNGLSQKVIFTGSRDDVPSILPQLDAFLYSSDHDTFGIAVIEAIAAAIPVFVNDWEVMQEITENGKYASLYKTKDPGDLLEKFLLFVENKNSYKQQSQLSATWVTEKYSIENHLQQLKNCYQQMESRN